MTNFTKSIMVAAAALTLAGAASAQGLKANIPFAFRVGDKLMQPGAYQITTVGTTIQSYRLFNISARDAALTLPNVSHDPAREWKADGKPRLAFECGTSECSLSELWDGVSANPAHRFPTSRSRKESMRVAVVVAEPIRAE
jgi:hypothetical protein